MCVRMKCFVVNFLYLLPCCLICCWAYRDYGNMPDLDCDFESDFCEWENTAYGYRATWERKRGKASNYYETGPSSDHTSGNGWYILLSTTRGQGARTVELYSPRIRTHSDSCLSFWYTMHGYDIRNLTVYTTGKTSNRNEIFSMYGPQGKRWYHAMVSVAQGRFVLVIEASYRGWDGLGDIAIDDISFSYDGGCSYDAAELMKDQPRFNCDFEDDLCSWYNVEDEGYIWKRQSVEADTDDRNALQPFSEDTSFAGIVRTVGYKRYLAVSLRGPSLSVASERACMSFWYKKFLNDDKFLVIKHGYGKGKYNSGGQELFVSKKQDGLAWKHVRTTLPQGNNYNIVFRVIGLRGVEGTVAVDDVTISHGGPCPEDKGESKINCDFDTNFCQWYMASPRNETDWERGQGPTPSLYTGPDHDHTKGDGYYVYMDASKVEKATLYSSLIDLPSEGSCLSFWYHMHGKDVANLSLNLYEFRTNVDRPEYFYLVETLWKTEGEHGDKWIFHEISLPSRENIALGFEAVRGYFPRGDIAIDDINISFEGICEKDVTTTTTTTEASTSTETVVNATTTETPKLPTPTLSVVGKVDPAFENTRVELICDGDNTGTQYHWYSSRFVNDEEVFQKEISTTSKYVINEIQLWQAGSYWCLLSKLHHLNSDKSNVVSIKVVPDPRPIPVITTEGLMRAEPAIVNRLVKLICGYSVEGATYHWKTTSSAFLGSDLPNNQTLLIRARPEHTGVYSCHITKDGYSTASSQNFNFSVTPGRRCEYDDMCNGEAYSPQCIDMRCECSTDAVLQDNSCELRPKQPKIYTSSAFLDFAYGETFYIVCEAQLPVPSTAAYTFLRNGEPLSDESESQTSNILKITNAAIGDGGIYQCFVTHRNIDSFHSGSISVKIKDFVNLSCEFAKDLCEWSTQTVPGYVNVSFATSSPDEKDQEASPSGPFIHVPKHDDKETIRAMLKSPTIKRTSLNSCLSFWNRMHGAEVYSLTVWKFTFSEEWQEDKGERLWTSVGSRGKNWFHERITVPTGEEFYIAIEILGTIAIDDIVFTYRGAC